jgi:hypothetical protein
MHRVRSRNRWERKEIEAEIDGNRSRNRWK